MDWEKATDEEIISKVRKDLDASRTFLAPHKEQRHKWYKLYRAYLENERAEGANLFVPYLYNVIETIAPQIVLNLLASRPYIGLRSKSEDREKVEAAQKHEALLDYQLMQRVPTTTLVTNWVKSALLYGTGIVKTFWRYEERMKKQRVPDLSMLGIEVGKKTIEVPRMVWDDPYAINVDLDDFLFDPAATTIDDASFTAQRFWKTPEELEELKELDVYENVDEVIDAVEMSTEENQDDPLTDLDHMGDRQKGRDKVEFYEYWTDDRVIVIHEGTGTLMRNEENPFWHGKKPFLRIVDTLVPGEFLGIGEIEINERLQKELNAVRNQRMDNVNLILNSMWVLARDSNINPEELKSRPGGIIHADDIENDLKQLEVLDVTNTAIPAEESIKSDIDHATGTYDYTRGSSPDRRETATTASILSSASKYRLDLKVRLMEQMGIVELGQLFVQLNEQYMDTSRAVRVQGDSDTSYLDITPDDVALEVDVVPLGSTVEPTVDKQARLNQLIQLYGMVAGSEYVDHGELIKRILKTADIKDADTIVKTQEDLAREYSDQMGQSAEGGGMGGGQQYGVPSGRGSGPGGIGEG